MNLKKQIEDVDKLKNELKSLIVNRATHWGSGLDENNLTYLWIIDTKDFLLEPRGLHIVTELFKDKIKKYNFDSIGGLTLASHLIASSLVYSSFDMEQKFDGFLVRRQTKEHGMIKMIEGPIKKNSDVIIIDDALNSAGYVDQAIKAVESIGCKVVAVIVLINFEREDYKNLRKRGYEVEGILTLKELGLQLPQETLEPDLYELKWRYGVITNTHYAIPKSSPVVHEDKIYIGSDQSKILCIDFKGKLVWEFNSDFHEEGVHTTPLIVNSKVIFAGYDGAIYAVDKNKGILIWKNKSANWIGCSPAYDPETNYFFIGLENNTMKGALAAVDADTGTIIWSFSSNSHMACKPAIGKNIVVAGSNDFFVYACDKYNGKLLWKFTTYAEVRGRITIDGDRGYATSFDGHIYCLELQTGRLIWKRKLGMALHNQPLIKDYKVFVGSHSNQMTAMDKLTGKVLWYFSTGGRIWSNPIYHEGLIYFGSHDQNIYVVDEETGKLVWRFITGGIVSSSPAIYNNKLFVNSNDGYLYCFEKKQSIKNRNL